jgi:hypothetical protein
LWFFNLSHPIQATSSSIEINGDQASVKVLLDDSHLWIKQWKAWFEGGKRLQNPNKLEV